MLGNYPLCSAVVHLSAIIPILQMQELKSDKLKPGLGKFVLFKLEEIHL